MTRDDTDGAGGRTADGLRFYGERRLLLAWRWRVADLTLREAAPPRERNGRLCMDLAADDEVLETLAYQWEGDTGLDDADGRPVRWSEVLEVKAIRMRANRRAD